MTNIYYDSFNLVSDHHQYHHGEVGSEHPNHHLHHLNQSRQHLQLLDSNQCGSINPNGYDLQIDIDHFDGQNHHHGPNSLEIYANDSPISNDLSFLSSKRNSQQNLCFTDQSSRIFENNPYYNQPAISYDCSNLISSSPHSSSPSSTSSSSSPGCSSSKSTKPCKRDAIKIVRKETFSILTTVQIKSTHNGVLRQQNFKINKNLGQFGDDFIDCHLVIIEQPTQRIRYRYRSEKGSHGGLNGANSSPLKKTYPTIKIENYNRTEPVFIRASLATNEDQPKLHVHKLMGKNCSDDGSCVVPISCNQIAIFQNLGILFIGKKEVPDILYRRKLIESKTENFKIIDADYQENDDGLRQKLLEEAEKDAREMNLNSVRICFEAFWLKNDQLYPICPKIYSRPIANQKSPDSGELKISRINRFFGSVIGGEEIYLLCEKVNKKEIRIRFFEIDNEGCQRWEAFGEFTETDVHHQVAIVFRTPPYRDQSITEPVQVYLQLFRLRDREYSEPKIFIYRPKMDHSQNEWTIHQDMITLDSSNNEDNQSLDQQRKCQPPYSSSSLNQIEKSMHRQQEVETSTMASIIISQPALIVKQESIESNLIDCLFHTKVLASSMDQSNIEFEAPSELNQQNYLHVYNKQQQKDEKIDFEQSNCIWNLSSDQNHHLCEHQHQNSNQSDLHIEGYSNHDDHSIRSSVSSLNTSQSRLSFYPSNDLHRHHQQAIA